MAVRTTPSLSTRKAWGVWWLLSIKYVIFCWPQLRTQVSIIPWKTRRRHLNWELDQADIDATRPQHKPLFWNCYKDAEKRKPFDCQNWGRKYFYLSACTPQSEGSDCPNESREEEKKRYLYSHNWWRLNEAGIAGLPVCWAGYPSYGSPPPLFWPLQRANKTDGWTNETNKARGSLFLYLLLLLLLLLCI